VREAGDGDVLEQHGRDSRADGNTLA
jgi:hypothetical protein